MVRNYSGVEGEEVESSNQRPYSWEADIFKEKWNVVNPISVLKRFKEHGQMVEKVVTGAC